MGRVVALYRGTLGRTCLCTTGKVSTLEHTFSFKRAQSARLQSFAKLSAPSKMEGQQNLSSTSQPPLQDHSLLLLSYSYTETFIVVCAAYSWKTKLTF